MDTEREIEERGQRAKMWSVCPPTELMKNTPVQLGADVQTLASERPDLK